MRRFFAFAISVIALLYVYLGLRLAGGLAGWLLLAVPVALVFAFAFVARRRRAGGRPMWGLVQASYLSMGFLSFLLVTTLARDLVGLTAHVWIRPAAAVGIAFFALAWASLRGNLGPAVRHRRLRYATLDPALEGFRVVQISDLHISPGIGPRYVERVVRKTLALRPNLIAFTGDIGDGPIQDLRPAVEALRPITGTAAPVFYVPGNHEAYWNAERWLSEFRALGMRVLLNEGEKAGPVFVGGITDPMFENLGQPPDLARASRGMGESDFKILLSHRPHFARAAAERGFDLQLSGHTHGGQFFPWTIVVSFVHRYARGAYRLGKMWVYVSMGTGSWGPLLRLGTTAEVTLLELTRA